MNPQYFEQVRAKALIERVKPQFFPDNGKDLFTEFGGDLNSACYLGPDGFVVRGVRISEAIAVPSGGRAAVLTDYGYLVKDNDSGCVAAFQRDAFETTHKRSLNNGTVVAGLDELPSSQGRKIMELNSKLQLQWNQLLNTPFLKSFRFKKIKAIKNDLELQQLSLSEHTSDLKRAFQSSLVEKTSGAL